MASVPQRYSGTANHRIKEDFVLESGADTMYKLLKTRMKKILVLREPHTLLKKPYTPVKYALLRLSIASLPNLST
jgi:hypothetical protein